MLRPKLFWKFWFLCLLIRYWEICPSASDIRKAEWLLNCSNLLCLFCCNKTSCYFVECLVKICHLFAFYDHEEQKSDNNLLPTTKALLHVSICHNLIASVDFKIKLQSTIIKFRDFLFFLYILFLPFIKYIYKINL